MKTFKWISATLFIACSVFFTACSSDDDNDDNGGGGSTEQILFGNGTQIGDGSQEFYVKESHTLKKGTYTLVGWVYIDDGASLTIEPGTVIKGDKETMAALIVQRGGKIYAQGTKEQPIVFTSNQPVGSRKPGDWGGIIVCGRATNNSPTEMTIEGGPDAKHGGNDDNDNSGILSYIRCEFAGYPLREDEEINGITFGSVGRGTQVDHLQVSYCNDDSFEWFGGTVNAKYLVAYHGWDDDFDTDYGFSGRLQFLLGIRHPRLADTSYSNGFESDNNGNGTDDSPFTACVFSNVTLVGPMSQATDFENNSQYINGGGLNPNNGSKMGIFQAAMQIRRNSRLNCFNSVAIGYPVGLMIENDKGSTTQTWATEGKLKLNNIYFAGMGILGSDVNKSYQDHYSNNAADIDETRESFSSSYFKRTDLNNTIFESVADLMLSQPNSMLSNPNYGPVAGSPLTGLSDLFTDSFLQDSFFEKVDYAGAFKSNSDEDNWLLGWTNFDPQNTAY